jgi:hypothetical protein
MKTNDLKKGVRVLLANGWYATIADNARGNTRMCDVEGFYREIGSVYSHDIVRAINAAGDWEMVEYTPAQDALRKQVEEFFV